MDLLALWLSRALRGCAVAHGLLQGHTVTLPRASQDDPARVRYFPELQFWKCHCYKVNIIKAHASREDRRKETIFMEFPFSGLGA